MIDLERRTITVAGVELRPSQRQFDLCAYLARRPGVPRSRAELMDAMGMDEDVSDVAVASHVKRIRKLGVTQIKTHYSSGYYWED